MSKGGGGQTDRPLDLPPCLIRPIRGQLATQGAVSILLPCAAFYADRCRCPVLQLTMLTHMVSLRFAYTLEKGSVISEAVENIGPHT